MLFLDSSIIQVLGPENIEIQFNGPSLYEILIPEGYLLKSIVTLLLITLVLAAILLHEQFTVKSVIGCLLIGAGTLVMVL